MGEQLFAFVLALATQRQSIGEMPMRERIVDYLSSASDEELREILFEVFKTKRPNPEEDTFNQNCFFLGTASIIDEPAGKEPSQWIKPRIEAVAYIDREVCPETLGPGWGFCQFGACGGCGTPVRSNYKDGICPICSAKVRMT